MELTPDSRLTLSPSGLMAIGQGTPAGPSERSVCRRFGSRLVPRLGIERMVRMGTSLMVVAGTALAGLALADASHPLAIIAPMFGYMVSFMLTMPPATAGALTPFPQIAGSASSLLAFCQFLAASTTALIVGFAFDGTARPMALAIAAASVAAFASFRIFRDK